MNARRRRRLGDVGFLALLAAGALLLWGGLEYHYAQVLEQVRYTREQIAQRDTRHLNRHVEHLLQAVDLNLKSLLHGTGSTRRPSEWKAHLDYALQYAPHLRSLTLIDDTGVVVASTNPDNTGLTLSLDTYRPSPSRPAELLLIGLPHAGRDFADGIPVGDPPALSPDLGFIPVARSYVENGRVRFSLIATLNMDYLERTLTDFISADSDRVSILRYDGTRLLDTASIEKPLLQTERAFVERWQDGESAATQIVDDDEQGLVIATYQLNARMPFAIVTTSKLDAALDQAHAESRQRTFIFLPLVITTLCIALAGYLFFRHAGTKERALRRITEARRSLLESALNASATAVVITSADGKIEWANPAFSSLTGYSIAEAIGRRPKELVNSGHQPRAFYEKLWRTILSGNVWRGELVNRRKDGSLYDEALAITPVRDEDGTLSHFIAVKEDISTIKHSRKELSAAYARLKAVVDHFPEALIMEDMEGRVTLLNDKVFEFLEIPPPASNPAGQPISGLTEAAGVLSPNAEAFSGRIDELRAKGECVYGEELQRINGRFLERDFIAISDEQKMLGFLRIYRDVTVRKAHERTLWQLANTDSLTGVHNRRAFLEKLEAETARIGRYGGEALLMMLDLDHFKRINDAYGHAAGDAVLCHVTALARTILRASDTIGRLGGEEFAILVPETGRDGGIELAERVRAAIEATSLEHEGNVIRITTSIGVTLIGAAPDNAEAVLARADIALYQAKRKGRNRLEEG